MVKSQYRVPCVGNAVSGVVQPPGSKSITNRALVCAALADGQSRLSGALDSEDTAVMIAALNLIGIEVVWDGGDLIVRGGVSRIRNRDANIYVANSGTTIRFLSSMLAAVGGRYRFDGVDRMRQRPIIDLVDAFNQLGVVASCGENGCAPLDISSTGFTQPACSVQGSVSSQYLSGLIMAAAGVNRSTSISVTGGLVSVPYIDITLDVMNGFGVTVEHDNYKRFLIDSCANYIPTEYKIEPDASAASYFFAIAAITGGTVKVNGLRKDAIQGDIEFCRCLELMGCSIEYGSDSITVTGKPLSGIDVDMNSISDTVPTLAVVALFATGPTNIRNVEHVRHKETDRITDLARELTKLGAGVEERQDGFMLTPGPLAGAVIDTYDDHRMAMSFAMAGLMIDGVIINDPGCCEKTYPNYFSDLETLIDG